MFFFFFVSHQDSLGVLGRLSGESPKKNHTAAAHLGCHHNLLNHTDFCKSLITSSLWFILSLSSAGWPTLLSYCKSTTLESRHTRQLKLLHQDKPSRLSKEPGAFMKQIMTMKPLRLSLYTTWYISEQEHGTAIKRRCLTDDIIVLFLIWQNVSTFCISIIQNVHIT